MAPPTKETVVAELDLGVNVQNALKDVTKLRDHGKQSFKALDKVTQFFGKSVNKYMTGNMARFASSLKNVVSQYRQYGKVVDKYNTLINRQQRQLLNASEEEKKLIQEKIEQYKRLRSEKMKSMKASGGGGGRFAAGVKAVGKGAAAGGKELFGAFKDIAQSAFKVGGSLMRKDLEGAIENGIELLGKAFKLPGLVGKGFKKIGDHFWKQGDNILKKGKAEFQKKGFGHKAKGAGMMVAGVTIKGLGGLGKAIGGLTKGLSTVAGSLGSVATIANIIIKAFMMLEDQAKGFNREVLQTADTSSLLYANGMDANKAYKQLSATMKDMRDDAYDISENLKWGITANEHKAFLQTLQGEGVTILKMTKEFQEAKKSVTDMTGEIQNWGDAVHIAVAFSRNWGVSLNDITQFVGEANTEMGQSFDSTMLSMAKMSRSAAESGVAANKFFAIIRSVSSDLNLYNTRVDQAAHLLKLMGKYMNPREMQKYMSGLVNMYKGMSEEDRIRQVYLMGVDKAQKVVLDDLADKTKALGKDIAKQTGISADEFETAMKNSAKDGGKAMQKILDKAGQNLNGAARESIVQLQMDYKRVQKGGAVGIAEAMQNLSAAGAVTATKAALQRFGGGKKLSDMVGLQAFAARKAVGISQDQFDQAVKLEKAIDEQRTQLVKQGKKQVDVDKMSDQEVIASMDDNSQAALLDSQKEINYAQEQTKLTSTLSQKVDVIIDGLFNYLYDSLSDVVDILDDFFEFVTHNSPKAQMRQLEKYLRNSNTKLGKDLAGALKTGKAVDTVSSAVGEKLNTASRADMSDMLASITSEMNKQAMADVGKKSTLQNVAGFYGVRAGVPTTKEQQEAARKKQRAAAEKIDMSADSKKRLLNLMDTGDDLGAALMKVTKDWDSPLTAQQLKPLFEALGESGTAAAANKMKMLQGGLGTPTGVGGAAMQTAQASAQQQASANSGGPTAPATVAATSTPGVPAATGGGVAPAAVTGKGGGATTTTPISDDQGDSMISGIDGLQKVLWEKGIRINKSFLRDTFWKNGHDSVLDAMNEALFNFALLTQSDKVQSFISSQHGGFTGAMSAAVDMKKMTDRLGSAYGISANASGGVVTGIRNNMADIARLPPAAPGEGWASIGKGETIVPAGGGGGSLSIPIYVSGPGSRELANTIKGHVLNGIAEYNRKHRLT